MKKHEVRKLVRSIIKEALKDGTGPEGLGPATGRGLGDCDVEESIMEQGSMPIEGYEFADGMNKAIKGKLDTKKCQEMQSLLWKSTTDSLGDDDKETLRSYWLTIFDDEVEAKFIGKPWYPFDENEITDANAPEDVEAAPDVETNVETDTEIDVSIPPEEEIEDAEEVEDEDDEEIT